MTVSSLEETAHHFDLRGGAAEAAVLYGHLRKEGVVRWDHDQRMLVDVGDKVPAYHAYWRTFGYINPETGFRDGPTDEGA